MTGPQNDRYQRWFADPDTRPSNERVEDPVVEATRRRVEELARFLDAELGGQVVAEAEAVLHPARPRMQAGDPGE